MLRHVDLFSGIGGFSLGFERTGAIRTVAFCEAAAYPRAVIAKRWPGVPCFEDIHAIRHRSVRSIRPVDIVSAGFPCQAVSVAGNQAGATDDRWLWPELFDAIGVLRPRYVVLENSPNLLAVDRGRLFGGVLGDLAALGFNAEWHCVPADIVGCNHLRDRLWLIAYADGGRREVEREPEHAEQPGASRGLADGLGAAELGHRPTFADAYRRALREFPERRARRRAGNGAAERECAIAGNNGGDGRGEAESPICRRDDAVPARVDRLRVLGNAIVPDMAELLGQLVVEHAGAP